MTPGDETAAETKKRTCHACGQAYEYPERGSRATRFHCPVCVEIPPPARKALERLVTRVRKLELALARMNQAENESEGD